MVHLKLQPGKDKSQKQETTKTQYACVHYIYICTHFNFQLVCWEKYFFVTYSALSCWNSLLQKARSSVAAVGHYFKAWCYLFSLWWIPMILGKYKNMIVISPVHHQSICCETFQNHLRYVRIKYTNEKIIEISLGCQSLQE